MSEGCLLTENRGQYSGYFEHNRTISEVLSLFCGFLFTSITILLTSLQSRGTVVAQGVLLFLTVVFYASLYVLLDNLEMAFHYIGGIPLLTLKVRPFFNLLLIFYLFGTGVVAMFVLFDLFYLSLVSGVIWAIVVLVSLESTGKRFYRQSILRHWNEEDSEIRGEGVIVLKFSVGKTDALIVGDVQMDFCPGGKLPVLDGDRIIPAMNKYVDLFSRGGAKVFATRDWHPPNHVSFEGRGGPWPPHCVQGTVGASFHPDLRLPPDVVVVSKAMDPDKESYSAFDGTRLEADLRKAGVKRVFMGGLATDYCVRYTVLDGLKLGFEMVVLVDATKGIDVKPGDSEEAVREMIRMGAKTAVLSDLALG